MASGIANSAANKALNLIQNLGRSVVATQYPDDFEYYIFPEEYDSIEEFTDAVS